MRWVTDHIAERRICEAMEAGEFDDLPGRGRPLKLVDDPLVPEELRAALRVMRNAGVVPRELCLRRGIAELEAAIAGMDEPHARARAWHQLALLKTQAQCTRGPRVT